jgi:transcriptional regulator with XRE-family HTH domain
MSDSFGARLRAERERKGISLDTIADHTKIMRGLFEGIERDDASRWPSGLFRRAFMRAYANEIGLEPEATVREFLERFPDEAVEMTVAVQGSDAIAAIPHHSSWADRAALRLTLAVEPQSFASQVNMLLSWSRSAFAAACDFAVVSAVAAAMFLLTDRFWTPFTIATVCYYFGGVLVLGNSPGGWLVSRLRKGSATHHPKRTELESTVAGIDETDNLRPFSPQRYPEAV